MKEIKNWVIPVIDKVDNLNSFVNYQIIIHNQMHYHSACDKKTYERLLECDEGAMFFALDDPLSAPEFEKNIILNV
ncbi:MAG: hypothetical protein K5979_09315 [Ruminococcus sp.]|nr:hypothetical protein [Ruminococcus sp.]